LQAQHDPIERLVPGGLAELAALRVAHEGMGQANVRLRQGSSVPRDSPSAGADEPSLVRGRAPAGGDVQPNVVEGPVRYARRALAYERTASLGSEIRDVDAEADRVEERLELLDGVEGRGRRREPRLGVSEPRCLEPLRGRLGRLEVVDIPTEIPVDRA